MCAGVYHAVFVEVVRQVRGIFVTEEAKLQNSLDREVTSDAIGEFVMDKLKELDEVAYVRFASVYRQFKDLSTFMEELNKLLNDK